MDDQVLANAMEAQKTPANGPPEVNGQPAPTPAAAPKPEAVSPADAFLLGVRKNAAFWDKADPNTER